MVSLSIPPSLPIDGDIPRLDSSLGAAFVGLIVCAILFGTTNVQVYSYFRSRAARRDGIYLNQLCVELILFLWILDALHLACITHYLYFLAVSNFGNFFALLFPTWSLCSQILVSALSDTIVRTIYIRRVWIMSDRNRFVTVASAALNVVASGSAIGFGIVSFTEDSTLDVLKLSWLLYLSLGSASVADLWISGYLFFRLRKGCLEVSSSPARVIIRYIVGTGLLTSICAICSFALFASLPLNTAFLGVHFCLCKLYYNALLATFNARDSLRDSNNTVSEKCLESLRVNGPTNLPMTYYSHSRPSRSTFAVSSENMLDQPISRSQVSFTIKNGPLV